MDIGEPGRRARLWKIKRPGGVYWFDLRVVAEDAEGSWLAGPVGTPWYAPHDQGTSAVAIVVWVASDRPWAAWWVEDPGDRRVEIDVCLPPEPVEGGWRYVDLELDPVLHLADGRVEIEDWDEYEEALLHGWMTEQDADLARSTAQECAAVLKAGTEPWLERGWQLMDRRSS